jgi:hypothetical protein
MKFHERWSPLRCRERGAALPMALAFLVLFAVLMGLIFDFIGTGMASNAQLKGERNDLYTVNGAVDAAISKIQNDPALGVAGGDAQCALNSSENGTTANVTCAPSSSSGTTVNTTSAPPFSILTMAPFTDYWNSPHTPSCSTVSTAPGAELGIIQFQKDKLLRVQGNVYVNSDVDSDQWSGGCPQVSDALAIHVNGDVKVREGCNDMYPVTTAFTWLCSSQSSFTPYQAPRATNGPASASDPSFADPAIANPTSWAPEITSPPPVRSVPSCPANNNVVKFLPGTYDDAAALSALMNGITCPGRTFWFSPGVYYFDFANGGADGNHEWRINDSNGKVVAGQPNAVPTGSTPVGPVPVTATSATTSSPGFTGPNDAILIGGNLATTGNFSTSGQQRWLRANGYAMTQSPIPAGSSAPVVQLHVVHGESWDTAGSSGTVNGWTAPTATPPFAATCTTTVPNSAPFSLPFCVSNDARTNNNTGAAARFATATTTSRSITLSGNWSGNALPAGATVTGVTAQVKHRESTANGTVTPSLSGTASGGCTIPSTNLTPQVNNSTWATQAVALPACVNNVISSLSLQYTASYTCSGTCPALNAPKQALLDSIELTVNYTVPAPVTPQFGAVQVQVLNNADNANLCTVDLAPTANNSIADATLPVPAGCLTQDALNNGTFSLRYQVDHGTCASACQNITSQLDGMELLVSYSAPGRSAWDPNDPAANPTVPGACRHDGDPFWSDGVQFVFGGDSRVYLQSGQVELCNAPSTQHQEIVLYQVKKATAPTNGTQAGWRAATATPSEPTGAPCPTSLPTAGSAPFCVPSDALSLNATGATARYAGVIPAATPEVQAINLAGGWSGTPLPAGAQVTGVSALVRHREAGSGGAIALALSGSAGGGCAITAQTVTPVTGASLGDQTFTLPACVNNNWAALSLDYTASYSCTTGCALPATPRQAILDGIELTISYTIPASTGALSPARGCVTQVPYYNPSDHSPGYDNDGAGPNPTSCALFKVAADAPGGDGHFPRVVTFWGTVYAPSAAMDVPVDVLTVPVFGRGVVARMLMLGYKVATDAQVPVTTAPLTGGQPQNRTVTLTGQANGKPTKVVATVEFCDLGCPGVAPPAQQPGGKPAVKVYSWQVTR